MNLIDDIVYEVDCAMVTEGALEVNIGGNPSAEGGDDEGVDDTSVRVNNIVNSFRLNETSFDKKGYMAHIKGYMKRVKAHLEKTNPDRVATFEQAAATFVKKVLTNFKDYDFYMGDSFDSEAMVVLMGYREDGITPYVIYFKDGMKETKV